MNEVQQDGDLENDADDSEIAQIATRDSWKTEPMPIRRYQIAFHRTLSEEEFAKIKAGHIPEEMEDRWFVFFEDDWLYFHRSWTGHCIFQVKLKTTGRGCLVEEAWANQDESQYRTSGQEGDIKILTDVFQWSLDI